MFRAIAISLGLAALVIGGLAAPMPDAPTAEGYFGEPNPQLTSAELAQFRRGERLFIEDWSRQRDGVANASSCVSCHSVPMPGGSGMSDQALVSIDSMATPGSRREVVQRGTAQANLHGEVRRTPALFGLGYLEVADFRGQGASFRLGANGTETDLRSFVSAAFATEMGVSTPLHCSRLSVASDYPSHCRARLTSRELEDVVAYLRFLAPPHRPTRPSPRASLLFHRNGCATCHTERLSTKPSGGAARGGQAIYPFSDLRRHDIGTSTRGPVRTAPLWGLNSYGPPYLHDGSAGSIEAAILRHGGAAASAREAFTLMSQRDRQLLLDYLRSF